MDEVENPATDSLTSGLGEAWDSLGDAYHNARNMAGDAVDIVHHTAAAMGDALLGDTAGVDEHLASRHGAERELSGDYDKLRRDLGLSAPDVPEPSYGDDFSLPDSTGDAADDQGYDYGTPTGYDQGGDDTSSAEDYSTSTDSDQGGDDSASAGDGGTFDSMGDQGAGE